MLSRLVLRTPRHLADIAYRQYATYRGYATAATPYAAADRTRNIGIIAHIDAGKTTTTERMLYYAGYTRQLGDVDEGSTITDFLPAERARGITIQSAAISFSWPPTHGGGPGTPSPGHPRSSVPHNINLIDTPGHADFTFEVLRSLRVLDGAVCILDSVAGVEAQTEKVWAQASTYHIPRLIFVNKLDRDGASFARTVQEVGAKLNVWPAVCMIPWWDEKGALIGIGDVVNLRALRYPSGGDGKSIEVSDYSKLTQLDAKFAQAITQARTALVELLAEHDDQMVEMFLEAEEDHLGVTSQDIKDSLRRCTLQSPQRLAPVFAGASFRNVGVQPLLDGVVDLLPSPLERPEAEISLANGSSRQSLSAFLDAKLDLAATKTGSKGLSKHRSITALQVVEACALAFKVVNDPKRGILVYVRAYYGRVPRNALLWNTNLQVSERAQRLLKMYANDAVDIDEIEAGQIGVIPGLKFARTGDSLIAYQGSNPKAAPPSPISQLQLRPIDVPPPVFFVSVEPNSLAEERHVKESLDLLLREDPSLNVRVDEESGQTHLAGMGELHLEIARDRLVNDLKAKARVGSIEISYREAVTGVSNDIAELYEKDIGGKLSKAGCVASVNPHEITLSSDQCLRLTDNNTLEISLPNDGEHSLLEDDRSSALSRVAVLHALQNGVLAALARGPSFGYPIHSTAVKLTVNPAEHIFPNTTTAALSSVARTAVQKALRASHTQQAAVLMEPVMRVAISVDESSLGGVVQDISAARGGNVLALNSDDLEEANEDHAARVDAKRIQVPADPFGALDASVMTESSTNMRTIIARVPLKEMVGYLKHLRSLTGGRGTFTMAVDQFERMSSQRVKAMISELAGDSL
ncbi:hypothetical protein AMS68_005499 [Peltaster fructicola]|uniref:Ribosome-releasing factor 2, mitochondrial n=1 Tax=Peltaster fructicola TaxID=286661 RepID=A0A6H0XYY3_9PEZI|nr:hypothetical protein AMS68_005499 [Peltaster fructicola]